MSKFTLGQRQFPTFGLWSQQPKNYVGPTLSCYLGYYSISINSCLILTSMLILLIDSKFIYPSAGHVVTGNLKLIPDSRICNIVSKGPKYRFPSHIDFNKRESVKRNGN